MDPSEYPPNSHVSRRNIEDRNIERVTSSDPIRKKKSIGRQLRETFISGDIRSSVRYGILDIFLPDLKDTILDALFGGIEQLFRGDGRRRMRSPISRSPYGETTYTNYGQFSMNRPTSRMSSPARAMSRMARARHDFDEIVLASRTEGEEVIDRLFDLVSRYQVAHVSDLYELVGIEPSHVDEKWGWTDLRGAGVTRVPDGYLLDLPDPKPV